jgi:hypothetical protein
MSPTTEVKTNPILDDVRHAIATKIGGPEGKNLARAIEKLAEETIKESLLAASPDFLDPIVARLCDAVFPIVEAKIDALIAQKLTAAK